MITGFKRMSNSNCWRLVSMSCTRCHSKSCCSVSVSYRPQLQLKPDPQRGSGSDSAADVSQI